MTSTSILRGFKVGIDTLDRFLKANGVPVTSGVPPSYDAHPDEDKISVLLYSKIVKAGGTADKTKFRVLAPYRRGTQPPHLAYVTYAWATVYAHRKLELDQDLPQEVPKGFEELREEISSFRREVSDHDKIPHDGEMGLYMVCTEEPWGCYTPQELKDRIKVPQYCDQCDMTFNPELQLHAFAERQYHRIQVHGSTQNTNPLPEA